ncbi:bacteriocin immunity protein [Pseudomonas sp. Teo4]|uniref:bacteriocin immunity protein n=1 Tax=Pseudomonas sp. Teo4 TaxID=3064528 RepID=UPI002AB87EE0|nr:bacteriocin immunity protein [Pseudomonas sp. Teo4]MDZ3991114.1 Colicin-E2 immunity protein [Pseudomonas sp. Teo4]
MKNSIALFTESEFTALVEKICADDFASERESIDAVYEFERLSEHPDGSDLIYYHTPGKGSPNSIVAEVKAWRAAHGKPGFKTE